MISNKANLVIEQGSTFNAVVILSGDIGNTAWQSRSHIRKHYQSTNFYVLTTNVVGSNLTLNMTATDTAAMQAGRYVYDIEMIDEANTVYRILEGTVTVTPEVTKTA